MVKILLRILGVLLVAAAPLAAWRGFVARDDIRGLENGIDTTRSEMAYRLPKQKGEEKIAEYRQRIEAKQRDRDLWFELAAGAVVVGICLAFLPSSRKRKVPAAGPVPAQHPEAPGPQVGFTESRPPDAPPE
jgi:hypothetical protein